jgi:hypothetical protein
MQVWEIRFQFPADAGIFYMPKQPLLYLDTSTFFLPESLQAVKLVTVI